MHAVQELLLSGECSRKEAFLRCARFLRRESRAWRLLRLGIPADTRGEAEVLLAWHFLLHSAAQARREELARELERVLNGRPETPLGIGLAAAVGRFSLPPNLLRGPFLALESDERVHTFTTRTEMLAHLQRLTVPWGRLMLRVLGQNGEKQEVLADALSAGLQLTLWTTRVREELEHGRLRVCGEDLHRFDVLPDAIEEIPTGRPLRNALAAQTAWTREHLSKGWPLCEELGHRTGRALAFVLRWHAASLSALEARDFALRKKPPKAGWLRAAACLAATVTRLPPRFE